LITIPLPKYLANCISILTILQLLGGCTTNTRIAAETNNTSTHRTHSSSHPTADNSVLSEREDASQSSFNGSSVSSPLTKATDTTNSLKLLTVEKARITGKLDNDQLNEVSGLVASRRYPGLLYAINDSGNPAALYAMDETGKLLAQWQVNARNRDWEDMAYINLAGKQYLVVGDTGDNLRIHKTATLLLFEEPSFPANTGTLNPAYTIRFRYDDGPRNVEAFAVVDRTLFFLSKEPVGINGSEPAGVYELNLPENLDEVAAETPMIANRISSMPPRLGGLESKLAAAFAGIDLSHPTAMAFDASGKTAYILTYREVLRIRRKSQQSWAEAFALRAETLFSHRLDQAEALAISDGRAIWFTSENAGAPIWAIPIAPSR